MRAAGQTRQRKLQRLGTEHDGLRFGSEAQFADDEFFDGSLWSGFSDPTGAAQQGAEAGEQLARGKSLWQVVVGTEFEADHADHLLDAASEHHDGHFGLRADAAQDLNAIVTEHHDIENNRSPLLGRGQVGPVLDLDLEAHGLEVIGRELAKLGVVVDDQEARGESVRDLMASASVFTVRRHLSRQFSAYACWRPRFPRGDEKRWRIQRS